MAHYITLQTSIFKVLYKNEELDQEGSLLDFFNKGIRDLVGGPFREEMNCVIHIKHSPDGSFYEADEEMGYRCRSGSDGIQRVIEWLPSENEFEEIRDLCISVSRVADTNGALRVGSLQGPSPIESSYDFTQIKEKCATGSGYLIPIPEAFQRDGLRIQIHAAYLIRRTRFIGWSMILPTRGMCLTIHHPNELSVEYESFGIIAEGSPPVRKPGLFQIRNNNWVLPGSGVAIELASRLSNEPAQDAAPSLAGAPRA